MTKCAPCAVAGENMNICDVPNCGKLAEKIDVVVTVGRHNFRWFDLCDSHWESFKSNVEKLLDVEVVGK